MLGAANEGRDSTLECAGKDIQTLMSEVEIASPQPEATTSPPAPARPETNVAKLRADQMDALPPGARTPRKMLHTLLLTRQIVEMEPLPKFVGMAAFPANCLL
ncbi:hypothetical protein PSACC_03737 [Paramicrosporidium saccamoebae]|uniref:Uncharacterized protein n=1 Tax=Paramicrosporidium saccamoebae TaxID=1246581 RepID=A0A2H9TFA0_9FUNG|nr:hypothetical protein PSACC_03737 [Paramicrosporidium saccamoebae]